ncbi:MAG TPA: FtsX-like permease family protein [Anaerolineaceae bacterium]|jgi:putative ABC transport system permease protein
MTTPRWKKVFADLWSNKARTLLVALSIVIGVFSIGFVASSYIVLSEDVPADYLSANPHAASIYADGFDDDLLYALRKTPGVASLEGRTSVSLKLDAPDGNSYPISITRVPALSQAKIDLLRLEQGSAELNRREIYIDRQVAAAFGYQVGDHMHVIQPGGRPRDLRIAGIVQDVTGNPFNWSKQVSGYVNADTLVWLGGSDLYDEMVLTVTERGSDAAHVRDVANTVADKVSKSGRRVYATIVMRPGQHPAQQTLNAVLVLNGGMGVLALFLSGFLVVNTISSLLSQQVRQIGVMKAIGATMGQVTGIYMVLVVAFGVTALLIAIPTAAAGAYGMTIWFTGMMDLNPGPFRIPFISVVLQVVIGLVAPVAGALLPVIGGARMTVRQAISSYGLNASSKPGWFDNLMEKIHGLPRPLIISIRNTFRRKGRLLLTLSTLTLGGAIFVGVFCVWSSMDLALVKTFGYILSDVNVNLSRPYRIERLQEAIKGVPGVVKMEGWVMENGQSMKSDGKTGDDIQIIAPPAGSQLIRPVLTSGRWLQPTDQNAVVVGNHYLKLRPETRVGDTLQIRLGEKDYPFQVIGIYEMAGNVAIPMIFANAEYVARATNQVGQVWTMRIVTDRPDAARQQEVLKALDARFKALGIDASLTTGSATIKQQTDTIQILIFFLLMMAVLISMVGGLGLMGTMSMNVMERTREIGVMRSIGAVDLAVFQVVVGEGLLIGVISWILGALAAIPISQLLDQLVGVSMLTVPLDFVYSFTGLGIWLAVVLVLSGLASLLPARNAVRLTVRDVLAYE